MQHKFCSNSANISKKSWNTQYDSTKELYSQAIEYESKFLKTTFELISFDKNEYAMDIAKFCLFSKGYKFDTLDKPANNKYIVEDSETEEDFLLTAPPPLLRQQATVEF